jgi:predicted Zn-dependent protease
MSTLSILRVPVKPSLRLLRKALRACSTSNSFLRAAVHELDHVIEQHGHGDHAQYLAFDAWTEVAATRRTLKKLRKQMRAWQAAQEAEA